MKLLVIIVNYRTAGLTIDCLESLRDEIGGIAGSRVLLVDNASGDASVERIEHAIFTRGWAGWAELKPLDQNGGFSAGNNAAIRPALAGSQPPEFILLLNPDTLVRTGSVRSLLEFMATHPRVGIAGSRLENVDGTPQRSAFRFPTVLSEFEEGTRIALISWILQSRIVAPPPPPEACPAQWVAGASMMIRREVFDAIGLLDEGYFMYFEEVDFCRRAERAGWGCWYAPQSRVVHLVGQSSGLTDASWRGKPRPAYWFASRKRFFLTHYGPASAFLADILWLAGFAFWRFRRAILRKPDNDPSGMLWDFIRYNFLGQASAGKA